MKTNKIIAISILIVVLALTIYSRCQGQLVTMQGDTISGWEMTFWEITNDFEKGQEFTEGDTLKISWLQELINVPFEDQPSHGIGDTTGYRIRLRFFSTYNNEGADSNEVEIRRSVESAKLFEGTWALTIKTFDTDGDYSRHSRPYWFNVKARPDLPPMFPVEIKVWLKD